ncbi:hypothetical protein ACT2FY_13095 [Paraburkholderia fungorum]
MSAYLKALAVGVVALVIYSAVATAIEAYTAHNERCSVVRCT